LFFHTVPSANTLVRWVNENAFASIVQARPCPTFGRPVHLRGGPHRLRPGTSPHALRIPSHDGHPALRRIAPPADDVVTAVFGYGAPHSSARGTSTLPNNALLSAHYWPLRHPTRPGLSLASCQLIPTAITAGTSRVASGLLSVYAIAITPAGSMELVRSSLSIDGGLPVKKSGRLLQLFFRGLLSVYSRYGLHARQVAMRPSTSKAPIASLPPLPLRLLL
jgi:hypothetical protein